MIILKDIVTGSELISDSYDLKVVGPENVLYEADCAMIQVGGESYDTGANASAEEAEEGTEDGVQKVNNVVHSFQLQEMPMDKKGYQAHLKAFLKRTKKYLETEAVFKDDEEGLRNAKTAEEKKKEAIETFLGGAQAAMKKLTAKFGDYECYIGEAGPSEKDDQHVFLLNYREDGVTPYFTFWRHALKEEKV